MINLHESYMAELRFKLLTQGSEVRCIKTAMQSLANKNQPWVASALAISSLFMAYRKDQNLSFFSCFNKKYFISKHILDNNT